ncbi:alpha-amylase [Clostridium sp.]|uniref:alpha-amylase n=1 Tax=Clostridium sp. TaxID=1506 RepID=UPI002611BE9C|nr:alpha-amylase [Clostridium sp.]
MGKISKAIKLKLQELRIDDIFKEKILKYKDYSKDEPRDIENESKEEKIQSIDIGETQEDEDKTIEYENKEVRDLNIDESIKVGVENLKKDLVKQNKIFKRPFKINKSYKLKHIKALEEVVKKIEFEEKSQQVLKNVRINETMMQYFEWYYPCDGSLWNKVIESAEELQSVGITALWLPPAYKATNGIYDVGYGAYDLYDLGEFNQKGTVRTKYGTKNEYLKAIEAAHKNNIKIYGDVVFNHKAGADESEIVLARPVSDSNRNEYIGEKREIRAHTVFNFPGRGNKYSKYKWSAKDFDGVDFDDISKEHGIFKFEGKEWEEDVDLENGNYDFLMFADLDMDNPNVINELNNWGQWYLEQTKVDGFRLDAIKHIRFDFFSKWLKNIRENSKKELFAVGEYWTHDVNKLNYYMEKSNNSMNLFDVPLHFNFYSASNSFGNFDMRKLTDNTFLKIRPDKAVTFVDNHDTQLGQSLESWVQPWFKLLAYTFILTRKEGYPCVFYGDYYGIPEKNFQGLKDKLNILLKARKNFAYGEQHDYMDNASIIGWTREGDDDHKDSGLAAVITVNTGGNKTMYVGHKHIGETWIDLSNQFQARVIIDNNGCGVFSVRDGSYSIWVKEI